MAGFFSREDDYEGFRWEEDDDDYEGFRWDDDDECQSSKLSGPDFEDEDPFGDEWQSSKIRGFNFEDEDPFGDLSNYQSDSKKSSFRVRDSGPVSDKVRAASAVYSQLLDRQNHGAGVSISDSISDSPSSSEIQILLCNDVGTLKSELVQSRKNLEKIQLTRYVPLHPKETIRNMFLGNPYSLEFYKSLTDKKAILEEAVAIGDGNVILTVVLFLYKTLSKSRLAELLMATSPCVSNQLAVYLEKRGKFNDLAELYTSLSRYNDSSLVHYRLEVLRNDKNIDSKVRRLKAILSSHFSQTHPDSQHLIDHIHLLERTSPVVSLQVQGQGQLEAEKVTVHDLLLYCSQNYFDAPENLLHSPLAIKKIHKLSEKQFIWPSLKGRAIKGQYKDCQKLALTKGWLGGTKVKTEVDPRDVAKLLMKYGASGNALNIFVQLIEPIEDRMAFAKKAGCHNVVVDDYVGLRDRSGLEGYKQKLVPQSEEWFYADNALKMTNTKWKN